MLCGCCFCIVLNTFVLLPILFSFLVEYPHISVPRRRSTVKMDRLVRILSRPTAKPYRTRNLSQYDTSSTPYINSNGHLDFSPMDIENPKNWSTRRRWYVTLAAVLLVLNATFASSSPTGTVDGIAEHFGISVEVGGLVTTLFLLGYCFGPLFWAPLSEFC